MKNVKISTNGQEMPKDIITLINKVKYLTINEAKIVISSEIDFLVCDLGEYHGNYSNTCAWIGGKANDSFTVNFTY